MGWRRKIRRSVLPSACVLPDALIRALAGSAPWLDCRIEMNQSTVMGTVRDGR